MMLTSHNWSPWPAIPQGSVSFCHLCRTRKVCETLPPSTVFLIHSTVGGCTELTPDRLSAAEYEPLWAMLQTQGKQLKQLCIQHLHSNFKASRVEPHWASVISATNSEPCQANVHASTLMFACGQILIFVKKKALFKKISKSNVFERRPQCFCSSSEINNLNRPN